jgi:hypothetical protein
MAAAAGSEIASNHHPRRSRRPLVRIVANLVFVPVTWACDHPVAVALHAAAAGRFPDIDGRAELVEPDEWGTPAVVSFTGHSFVMTDLAPAALAGFELDGYGAATEPRLLTALAGSGTVGSIDVVLTRHGTGRGSALDRLDLHDDHPRVVRARHHRRDVRVLGDGRGFVTIGNGLLGRVELSVELLDVEHGRGAGRDLITAALDDIAADEVVFAQVAPGNAASLRAFLASGFVPIGSEVLIEPSVTWTGT